MRVVGFAALRRWRNKAAAGAGLCCSYVGAGLSRVTGRAAAAAVAAPLAEGYAGGVDDLYNSWAAASSAGRLGRARRTVDIWATVCRLAWRQRTLLRRYAADDAAALSAARRQLGADAREALLALGPTFIKLGQLLSTRVDILPREYIEELSLLHAGLAAAEARRSTECGTRTATRKSWRRTRSGGSCAPSRKRRSALRRAAPTMRATAAAGRRGAAGGGGRRKRRPRTLWMWTSC